MTCNEVEVGMLPAWLDGELSFEEDAAVTAHLKTCETCRNAVAKIKAESEEIRLAVEQTKAPAHLYDKTIMQWASSSKSWSSWYDFPTHWHAIVGLSFVALIAISISLLFNGIGFDRDQTVSVHEVVSETIQDYRKFQASQRSLDVASDDASETLAWLSERVETPFPNVTENIQDYRLKGGRLCLLVGQRLGALTYSKSDSQIAVYIFPGALDRISDLSELYDGGIASFVQSGLTSMVWEQHGLVVVLLSSEPTDELQKFASAFRRSMNGLEQHT